MTDNQVKREENDAMIGSSESEIFYIHFNIVSKNAQNRRQNELRATRKSIFLTNKTRQWPEKPASKIQNIL